MVPIRAEEGLAGHLPSSSKKDVVGCYGHTGDLTEEEVCVDMAMVAVVIVTMATH